jgi:hypothetical protein
MHKSKLIFPIEIIEWVGVSIKCSQLKVDKPKMRWHKLRCDVLLQGGVKTTRLWGVK